MKTIVIFGAASAIAQATAKELLSKNPHYILLDRDQEKLHIVAQDLKTRDASQVNTIATDLSDTTKHIELWNQIKSISMPDTVLIAYGTLGDQKASEKDWHIAEKELMTNFMSVASLLTLVANDFQKASEAQEANAAKETHSIIAISSVAGDRGRKSNYIYGSAKGALSIFLAGLRNRLSSHNVNVITIKPGFVDTPMTASFKKGLLWAKPEAIAKDIVSAIQKKRAVVYTPWFWRYIMIIIRLIPESIFKKMWL